MRHTRDLILGFAVGALIGLLVYLRLQRQKRAGPPEKRSLELVVDIGEPKTTQTEADTAASPPPRGRDMADDLEEIRGVGPVYARRLNDVGVNTFTGLAGLTPEKLRAIIGPRVAGQDFNSWIQQARDLAGMGEG